MNHFYSIAHFDLLKTERNNEIACKEISSKQNVKYM